MIYEYWPTGAKTTEDRETRQLTTANAVRSAMAANLTSLLSPDEIALVKEAPEVAEPFTPSDE